MSQPSSPVFRQTMFIAAPAARVWGALVTPNEVVQYHLCPLQALEPRVAGRIVYGTDGRPLITGSIIEFAPERRLVHTFQFDDTTVKGDAESRVTYAITPMGTMCQLTLTHEGFDSDNQTYANVAEGWPTILSGLKTLVETGKPLPWPTGDGR